VPQVFWPIYWLLCLLLLAYVAYRIWRWYDQRRKRELARLAQAAGRPRSLYIHTEEKRGL
jgi:hypothetical protein